MTADAALAFIEEAERVPFCFLFSERADGRDRLPGARNQKFLDKARVVSVTCGMRG